MKLLLLLPMFFSSLPDFPTPAEISVHAADVPKQDLVPRKIGGTPRDLSHSA
jgi:hypothetical protein